MSIALEICVIFLIKNNRINDVLIKSKKREDIISTINCTAWGVSNYYNKYKRLESGLQNLNLIDGKIIIGNIGNTNV